MPPGPRTRPAKTALSREAVVAAALRVVDDVGYDAASMRRVAAELETGPASLYVYVDDRRELMEAVHDLALAEKFADLIVPITTVPTHDGGTVGNILEGNIIRRAANGGWAKAVGSALERPVGFLNQFLLVPNSIEPQNSAN